MIVLKILLYIILAVLGIVTLFCLLPVKAEVSFIDEKLKFKVKYSLINVMDSDGGGVIGWLKKRKGKKSEDNTEDDEEDFEDITEESDETEEVTEDSAEISEESTEELTETEEIEEIPEEDVIVEGIEEDDTPEDESEEDEKESEEDNDEDSEKDTKKKKTLGEKVEFVLDLWRAVDRPLLKIFKGIRLYDLYIDFITADEDAYKCAMLYGNVSGIVYNLIAWLSVLFTVRLDTVDINAGFGLEKSRWDGAVKVDFRLGTLIIAGVWFLAVYLFKYHIPNKLKNKKNKK